MVKYKRLPSIQVCAIECGAKCCKSGHLIMNTAEMRRLKNLAKEHKKEIKVYNDGKNRWALDFRIHDSACPFLEDNLCTIYEDRPEACQTFPTKPSPNCLVLPLENS